MLHPLKWGLTFTLLLFLGMSSVAEAGSPSGTPTIINMENWAPYYRPYEAAVPSQTPILWKNPTASPHTIRHDGCIKKGPCLFDSGAVAPDGSFTLSGLKPGRYPYHCELHPIMRGELIVEGSDSDIDASGTLASFNFNGKN